MRPIPSWREFHAFDFYEAVRNFCGDLVEKVRVTDSYEHPKFKKHSMSYKVVLGHTDISSTLGKQRYVEKFKDLRSYLVETLGVEMRKDKFTCEPGYMSPVQAKRKRKKEAKELYATISKKQRKKNRFYAKKVNRRKNNALTEYDVLESDFVKERKQIYLKEKEERREAGTLTEKDKLDDTKRIASAARRRFKDEGKIREKDRKVAQGRQHFMPQGLDEDDIYMM